MLTQVLQRQVKEMVKRVIALDRVNQEMVLGEAVGRDKVEREAIPKEA